MACSQLTPLFIFPFCMKFLDLDSSNSLSVGVLVLIDYQHPIVLQAFLSVDYSLEFSAKMDERRRDTKFRKKNQKWGHWVRTDGDYLHCTEKTKLIISWSFSHCYRQLCLKATCIYFTKCVASTIIIWKEICFYFAKCDASAIKDYINATRQSNF